MAFLYNIITDYTKQSDTLTDIGISGEITTLKGYLDSVDEVIFDAITTATCEILTMNSIDNVSDEYLYYLSYLLGYNWNFHLDVDLQRTVLKNILQIYKRKGTKFAFHFNLYQLDSTVSICEPYQELFVLDKSKLNVDRLPSHDYYSYGILVIKLNKYVPDIIDIIEYIRPAGWKIILEFNYTEYYSFHIKPNTIERNTLLYSVIPIDYNYSKYTVLKNQYKDIYETEEDVHLNVSGTVIRSMGHNDYLPIFFKTEFVVDIIKIYKNNSLVFEPNIDYILTNNNQVVEWTVIGQTKIEPNDIYYVEYIKNNKLASRYYYNVDSNVQDHLKVEIERDKYYYNEFGVPITISKLSNADYDIQYVNAIQYSSGQYMPVTMVGHTSVVGMHQPALFKVDNQNERYDLANLTYWEPKNINHCNRISGTIFNMISNVTFEYSPGKKLKFNDKLATITTSLYNKISNTTTVNIIFDDITDIIPIDLESLSILRTWVFINDIIYQKDLDQYYIAIDVNKLNSDDGYVISPLDLPTLYNNLNFIPSNTAKFTSIDLKTHNLLYETPESDYTFYRNNLQYSDYMLLDGEIFIQGETKNFVVPSGVNEVIITTCGSGGGSSNTPSIANGKYIAVGGGGGAVIMEYRLSVLPGDALTLVSGMPGLKENDGEAAYVEIKRTNSPSGKKELLVETYAAGGKAPEKINQLIINNIGINGVSWFGGKAGGHGGGSGGAIWTKNINVNSLGTSLNDDFVYSDYGNPGLSSGGKSIIEQGMICGGGGSFGIGAGKTGVAGYGGGGCALIDNGRGGLGFVKLTYDITMVIED